MFFLFFILTSSSFIFCFAAVVVVVVVVAVVFNFLLLNWIPTKKFFLELSRINSCPKWVWTNILNRPIIWEMPMSNFIKTVPELWVRHSQLYEMVERNFLVSMEKSCSSYSFSRYMSLWPLIPSKYQTNGIGNISHHFHSAFCSISQEHMYRNTLP